MKIKKIALSNFRSFENEEFAFSKLNLVSGKNGAGKTSIMKAIHFVLTGSITTGDVKRGEETATVVLTMDDGTAFGRSYSLPDSFMIDGKEQKESAFKARLSTLCSEDFVLNEKRSNELFVKAYEAGNLDFIRAFFSDGKTNGNKVKGVKECEVTFDSGTTVYFRKGNQAKLTVDGKKVPLKTYEEMLRQYLPSGTLESLELVSSSEVLSSISMGDFSKYLLRMIPLTVDFKKLAVIGELSDDEQKVIEPLLPAAPQPIAVFDIANAYKLLYDTRQEIGRRLTAAQKRAAYEGPAVTEETAVLQEKIGKLNQAIGAAAKIDLAWKNYEDQRNSYNSMVKTYNEWRKQYSDMPFYDMSQVPELKDLESSEKQLREQVVSEERLISQLTSANRPIVQMLNNLNATVCPLCDKLICQTDKTACRNDLERVVAENEQNINSAKSRLAQAEAKLKDLCSYMDQVRKCFQANADKTAFGERIKAYRATIPAITTIAEPEARIDVSAARMELAQCEAMLKSAHALEECKKAEVEVAELQKQRALYDVLVKKSNPKNGLLTMKIMEVMLAPFKSHCDQFIQKVFSDTEISFQMGSDGLHVLCRPHGKESFVSIETLSSGERMLTLLTLMDMIAQISKAGIMVFDNLEALDEEAVESLVQILSDPAMMERYDHIIVSAVAHPDIVTVMDVAAAGSSSVRRIEL